MSPTQRRIVFFGIPLVLGLGVLALMLRSKKSPEELQVEERSYPLRFLSAEAMDVVPRAIGYGVAEPAQTWRAVARVEGRVIELHPALHSGGSVAEGELLFRLESTPFELAVARTQAEISRLEAQLVELEVSEANDRAALAIEQESLDLITKELERITNLREEGSVSQSEQDSSMRQVLAQRQSVQSSESALALLPTKRATTEAQLAAQRASLKEAELELSYATVRSPLDGLLANVSLDLGQFVARGEALFEVLGSKRIQIDTEFLFGDAKRMIGPKAKRILATAVIGRELEDRELRELFKVRVRMRSGALDAEWPATVLGLREDVSETTRSLVLRIAVDDPLALAIPGVRPALLRGSFCSVELRGETMQAALVVPRSCLLNGAIHLIDSEDRLASRPVEVLFEQGDFALISEGLSAGERVVLSDTGSAFDGARVIPIEDAEAAAYLRRQAQGEEPLR